MFAFHDEHYPWLVRYLTADAVAEHFRGLAQGEVLRYELPKIAGLNFVMHRALERRRDTLTRARCSRQVP